MPTVELRLRRGKQSPEDIVVNVQDATYAYLLSSEAPEIRVSAYLDRDWAEVRSKYAELHVNDQCPFESTVTKLIPGSRARTSITLPGPMHAGEQLTVVVSRRLRSP